MPVRFEELAKLIYKRRKMHLFSEDEHPDEEVFACFIDGKLPFTENERIKAHLLSCESCAEILALSINSDKAQALDVPEELLCKVRELLETGNKSNLFEIILRLKAGMLEVINTTGDILMGQELVPAPVLRSRNIKDFKNEVVILKDLGDSRIEVRIENKGEKYFSLVVKATDKRRQEVAKDLRVTLLKDNLELESYSGASNPATFEHILIGRYNLEVQGTAGKVSSILLDVKG